MKVIKKQRARFEKTRTALENIISKRATLEGEEKSILEQLRRLGADNVKEAEVLIIRYVRKRGTILKDLEENLNELEKEMDL